MKFLEAMAWVEEHHGFPEDLCDFHNLRFQELAVRSNLFAGLPPLVVVAGSCGKASTARFLAHMLSSAGLRVGLGTKPPLSETPHGHRERYQMLVGSTEQWITPDLFASICQPLPRLARELSADHGALAPYDLRAWILLRAFMEWKVDVGIVEANIGLRFDPVGAVPAALTVLTPIATDHAQLLRPPPEWEHLGAAAGPLWHKLSKVPSDRVVVGRQPGADPTTVDALVSRPGPRFGRDFRLLDVRSGLWGSRADVVLPGGQRTALELTCLGAFQAENALTAAAAYLELGHTDLEAMRQGALRCQIPGRLQVVGQDPLRLLCVASSKAKVEGLLDSLEPLFENAESGMVMVLTLLDRVHARDEVIDYIARHPRLRALIATQGTYADDSRDLPPWQVADLARQAHPGLTIASEADPSVALRRAEAVLQPGDIMVLLGNGLAAFLAGSEALAVKGEIGASPGDR